jgi:hypothetical protein
VVAARSLNVRARIVRFGAVMATVVVASLLLAAPTAGDARGETVGASAVGDAFGDAVDLGSMHGRVLAQPVVGMAATRTGRGYWLVASDGGIFSFGDAAFHGSTGAIRLNQPIVGMTSTPTGNGYWFVASDGGIFSFGDASFHGSTGAIRLNRPIVGMAATRTGRGYWLVASDGGIFTFGDARFFGAATGRGAVGISASPTGGGYVVVTADGTAAPFGDARVSAAALSTPTPGAIASAGTPDGAGYWATNREGTVMAYGGAPSFGPANAASNVVGMASTATGKGYWLVTSDGSVLTRVGSPSSSSFGFLSKDRAGRPMRFNPCAPIRFVINPEGAPGGAVEEVREAFRRLGEGLGVRFVDAGTTTERHIRIGSGTRTSYQPSRYGTGQWAPLLISWVTAAEEPVLAGNVLGYGGSTSHWNSTSDQAYVTGEVVFDRDLSIVRPGFGSGLTRGNLAMHELGHVAGLDHVDERAQLMFPSISTQSPDGFGSGDRAGLAQIGVAAGCLKVASPTGGTL